MLAALALFIIGGCVLLLIQYIFLFCYGEGKGEEKDYNIPCASGWFPLVGHLAWLKKSRNTANDYFRWHQELGSMFQVFLGRQQVVVLSSIDLIKEARRSPKICDHPEGRYHSHEGSSGAINWTFWCEGKRWKKMRSATQKAFNTPALRGYTDSMNRQAEKLIKEVKTFRSASSRVEKTMDFASLTFCMTWSIIEETMAQLASDETWQPAGDDASCVDCPQAQRRSLFTDIVREPLDYNWIFILKLLFPEVTHAWFGLLEYLPLPMVRLQQRMHKGFLEHFKSLFSNARRMEEKHRPPMLQGLISLMDKPEKSPAWSKWFAESRMILTLAGFLIGGSDTTSFALAWAIHYVALDEKVRSQAMAEIRSFFGTKSTKEVSFDDAKNFLPYCNAVIKETLRIQPPLLVTTREAKEDVLIGGKAIPKGAWIHFDIWTIHRSPQNFPDPDKFCPERFLDDASSSLLGNNLDCFIPFGTGDRMCPGKDFALLELVIAFAKCMNELSFSVPISRVEENVERVQSVVSAYAKNGIHIRFHESDAQRTLALKENKYNGIKKLSRTDEFTSSWVWMILVWAAEIGHFLVGFPEFCPDYVNVCAAPYREMWWGLFGWRYSWIGIQLCHVLEAFAARNLARKLGYSPKNCSLWFWQTLSCGLPSSHLLLYRYYFSEKKTKMA